MELDAIEVEGIDREAFRAGFAVLKSHLAEAVKLQCRDKQLLRMPRKTKEERERLRDAVFKRNEHTRYWDMGLLQSDAAMRKPRITALLATHNTVRGKEAPYRIAKYDQARYNHLLKKAQELFDTAVAEVKARRVAEATV